MNGDELGAESCQAARPGLYRTGNVVQLQVDEQARTDADNEVGQPRPLGVEELGADLETAHISAQRRNDGLSFRRRRDVEC